MQNIIEILIKLSEEMDEKQQKKLNIHKLVLIAQKIEEKEIKDKSVNQHFEKLIQSLNNEDYKAYRKEYQSLINVIENKYNFVEKEHFIGTYIALGLSLGTGIGVALMNINSAFFPIGIGCGLSIGVAIGTSKDNEALKNNNVY